MEFCLLHEICRPTFSAHSLKTSICLAAFVSLSARSSANARRDICMSSLGRPSPVGFLYSRIIRSFSHSLITLSWTRLKKNGDTPSLSCIPVSKYI